MRGLTVSGAVLLVGHYHVNYAKTLAVRRAGAARGKKFFGSGRYNMPGAMMTKAGKRRQMQIDTNRASPRKGKPR